MKKARYKQYFFVLYLAFVLLFIQTPKHKNPGPAPTRSPE